MIISLIAIEYQLLKTRQEVYYVELKYNPKKIADKMGVPEFKIQKIINDMNRKQ